MTYEGPVSGGVGDGGVCRAAGEGGRQHQVAELQPQLRHQGAGLADPVPGTLCLNPFLCSTIFNIHYYSNHLQTVLERSVVR